MGLTGALNIGATGLGASQLAIQITGNNLANAATPGYSRQMPILSPTRPENFGRMSIGTGVRLADVRRNVDEALQQRLWQAISSEAAAAAQGDGLGQLEALLDELGERSLSDQLRRFFTAWSERANLSQSSAVVIQQGAGLANFLSKLRGDVAKQTGSDGRQLGALAGKASQILDRIAGLNREISDFEAGGGQANTLRDQRDQLVGELSQQMEVSIIPQRNGTIDVLVGSTPVVLGGTSRGLRVRQEVSGEPPNTTSTPRVVTADDGSVLCVKGGRMGALLEGGTDGAVAELLSTLDRVTEQLIFRVNSLHATGFNRPGYTSLSSTVPLPIEDRGRSLNSPLNTTMRGLPWRPTSGSLMVEVTGPTGASQQVRIDVDLDGRLADGRVGFDDDTTLEGLAAQLLAIDGLSARVSPEGRLEIEADPGFHFGFSQDTSGVLATLGVNSFFTGRDARDIAVREELRANPVLLATGRLVGGTFVENGTALELAQLRDAPLEALGGRSIQQAWTDQVQQLGLQSGAARDAGEAAKLVRESLEAQREAISGVSIDEESINLLNYQRVYQASARFISVVDDLTRTLLSIV